ncbi:hypothetical protein LINPERPRIM_LOCUS30107 [Linum perenne]
MVLRRWFRGIAPLAFSPAEIPTWVVLKKVPPVLVTPEGISWLASQVGRPINKSVRDGLDFKVCVVKDASIEPRDEIVVDLGDGECAVIQIEVSSIRTYSKGTGKQWVGKNLVSKSISDAEGPKQPVVKNDGVVICDDKLRYVDESVLDLVVEDSNDEGSKQGMPTLRGLSPNATSVTVDGMIVSDEELDAEFEVESPKGTPSVQLTGIKGVQGATHADRKVEQGGDEGELITLSKPTLLDFMSKGHTPKMPLMHRPKTRRR